MISVYPDQEEFITEIRNLFLAGHMRIVGNAPTGFGKTRVAARIVESYYERGWRTCFIVPRVSLMEQTARAFMELGLDDITYLWADRPYRPGALITLASAQTYIRREKGEFKLTIVDECHLRQKQILQWMKDHPKDRYLGLSGTPYAKWIGEYYTALAKSKPMRWLIDNGRLSEYEVFAPSVPNLKGVKMKNTEFGRDYSDTALEAVMGDAKLVGDIVENWLARGENRLTIALCVSIAHANQVCIEFNRAGVTAEVITADTPVEEREQIFSRMRAGITRVITSVNALTEGLDIKEVSCVINARPTRSKARYLQGMGRGLRACVGKTNCLIFDHSGTTLKLGLPEDIHIDDLNTGDDGMKEAKGRTEKEKTEKVPTACPKCNFLKPAGMYVCGKCGFKPLHGEDVDTRRDIGLTHFKKTKRQPETTKLDKQRFFSELLGYQEERFNLGRPISDGWVARQYREKFGVWPKGLDRYPCSPSVTTRNYIKSQFIKFARSKA